MPEGLHPPDLHVTKLFDNQRVVIGRKGHPLAGVSRLVDLAGAEWLTTSITHDAVDELAQVFAEEGLPPPRMTVQCQSALSILTVLMNSDILAMVPMEWVDSPMLQGLLEEFHLDRPFAAPPLVMVHRTGIGLTPAGEHFSHLIQRAAEKGSPLE